MERVSVKFRHCYGIKALDYQFDFRQAPAYAIYAPNGAMKSSFAKTFDDLAKGATPSDRIFSERETTCEVVNEGGAPLPPEGIFVISPYDETLIPSEKTSTLLVNAELRNEYTALHTEITKARNELVAAIKAQSKSKMDLAAEVSSTFTRSNDTFDVAVSRVQREVADLSEAPLASIEYDKVFAADIVAALESKDLKNLIEEYTNTYNALLEASTYFKKGTFEYYNAGEIAKTLTKHGFFKAKHTVTLNSANGPREISNQSELEAVIDEEKQQIISDPKLRSSFDAVAAQLNKNAGLRDFATYISQPGNEPVLSRLSNIPAFKEDVLKSYLKSNEELYNGFVSALDSARERKAQIEETAARERTRWEQVIDIFNDRFVVPFKLEARNRVEVMLGSKGIIDLGFTYVDGAESRQVDRGRLLQSLSTGEKKALYILNVIFEIETRIGAGQETLVIVDDVADSFDYQNKYAIIQYLRDISESGLFNEIILTHNFDFFRTLSSRFVGYKQCLMATKSDGGITLHQAAGIKNIFANDWKPNFFGDDKKKIASIPFLRNLIEFTRGDTDLDYQRLTAMLHWQSTTGGISVRDLDQVYNRLCGTNGQSSDPSLLVVDLQEAAADASLAAPTGVNFENKIVLAIAIRMRAERFMEGKIADKNAVAAITANQTHHLLRLFRQEHPNEAATLATLDKVGLVTPENIHLNSFMYEPIVDMSDEQLKRLWREVKALG